MTPGDTLTIQEAFWLIVENKWKIFQVLLISIVLAVFYHQWAPKIFEIKARIMVFPRQNSQNNAPDWLFELSGLETVHNISNELEILKSIQILSQVGKSLGESEQLTSHQILNNLSINNIKNTEILELSYRTEQIDLGKEVLKHLLKLYENKNREEAKLSEIKSLKFLDERLLLVLDQLREIELKLEKLKINAPETLLIEDYLNFYRAKTDDIQNRLTYLTLELEELNHLLYADSIKIYPVFLIQRFPHLRNFISFLFEENKATGNRYEITEKHPFSEGEKNYSTQKKGNIKERLIPLESKLNAEKINLLTSSFALDSTLKSIPGNERIAINLLRNQKMVESIYLLLLEKKEETSLALASQTSNIKVIDPPFVNRKIRPNPYQTSAIVIMAGLFFPILYIIGKKNIDRRLFHYKDFAHKTSMPFLSEIPQGRKNITTQHFYKKSNASIIEQVRLMKAHLAFLCANTQSPVFLISSYWSGEGKTYLSAHLGYAFALEKIKTVIVGADLRKPTLQKYFENQHLQPGLSNYLIQTASENEIIQSSYMNDYLDGIQSGPIPPNPTELIANGQLEKLIKKLRQRYECIILDSPPIGLVADALQISSLATHTIFVLKFKKTKFEHLEFLNGLDLQKKVPAPSIVLNGVPLKKSKNYYYYNQ
ncbi:MAG: GumC family protein [Saprospiraceae bacterium]